MRLDLKYLGRSGVRDLGGASAVAFVPNLAREAVAFDGELRDPVRYREAMSALHEIVVGDLRAKVKDRSAHDAWKAQQERDAAGMRAAFYDQAKRAFLKDLPDAPPAELEADFKKQHALYWHHRRAWAAELWRDDPALFRALVPCDPVVTVAPDVVMFECFAKDESSYGCVSVDRDAFSGAGATTDAALGTTNVDYSLALFEHFQTVRSYRPTRLLVDPAGFAVATAGASIVREEKIDLPATWLRGFGQLQAAMALPARRVSLSVDAVYSILAYLKRHRETTGPRSLRFVLAPGKPVRIVLEPWGVEVISRGPVYAGPKAEDVKVWGRRRLFALARTLPLAERVDVQLLGSGLPSVWIARMGAMRLTLALSGWTANDWSRGANLDQLAGGGATWQPGALDRIARTLLAVRSATIHELATASGEDAYVAYACLHELAKRGQVAYDFATERYRWRSIMPVALSEAVLGPEPEEVTAGKALVGDVKIERDEAIGDKQLVIAKVGGTACEGVLDRDGGFGRAKCTCSYFHRFKLRGGPCRHLLALRLAAQARALPPSIPMARTLSVKS